MMQKIPTSEHPRPYKLSWLDEKSRVWASTCFSGYMDQLWCDMVLAACALLLRHPWQPNRSVIHHGRDNIYGVEGWGKNRIKAYASKGCALEKKLRSRERSRSCNGKIERSAANAA